jgi:hypothetical protein
VTLSSGAVTKTIKKMASIGWDCFDDDEDEEEVTTTTEEISSSSAYLQDAFVNLFPLLGSARKDVQFGPYEAQDVDIRPRVEVRAGASNSDNENFINKLKQANFLVRQSYNDFIGEVDCVVDLRLRKLDDSLDDELKAKLDGLRPGGLAMFAIEGYEATEVSNNETGSDSIGNDVACRVVNRSLWLTESAKLHRTSANVLLLFVRRRSVLINQSAILWKPDQAKLLAGERTIAEEITVCRTCASSEAGTLSQNDVNRAVTALEKHGVCVIPRMFDAECVKAWGRVAITDLQHALKLLKNSSEIASEDIEDNAFSGENLSHNYHELAMRESYRVDIRHGPRMLKHAANILKQVEETSNRRNDDDKKGHKNLPFARHFGLMKVFQQVMNPHPAASMASVAVDTSVPRPFSSGNFGRWNFEGSGPNTEVPLTVGAIGAVMSMPRCADQAVHADTYHLFENSHLPPHYVNFFLPAMEDVTHCTNHDPQGGPSSSAVGQTAFIVGTHRMSDCERIMEEDSETGRAEKMTRLLRPHVSPGDLVLFDTRVLHIGLANDSHRKEYPTVGTRGVWRPVLYANVTQRWFEDKKNWEKKELFTPEEREIIDAEGNS